MLPNSSCDVIQVCLSPDIQIQLHHVLAYMSGVSSSGVASLCGVRTQTWTWLPAVTSIVFDLAATLFTPETPKEFCGLKHFTHPSIGLVVRRWWMNFNFHVKKEILM